ANANTELDETNRALDDTNRALDDTNNELRATNEQLRTANDVLESQAANLDASRLAALANEQAANRLDLALLLAAQAQRRAATDDRIPQRTLFGLLEAGARDFDGLLQFRPGGDLPAVTVSPAGERV